MAQLIDTSKNIILEEGEREFWDKEFPGISKTNLLFRWGKYYPFHLFTKTHNPEFVLGKNLFITTWNKRLYKLPPDLDKIKKKLIENERKRRKRIGGLWWSDKQCRLRAIEAGTPLDKDKVQLHLEMVDYADHFISNLHLNKPVLPGRKTIREKFIKNPDDIFALEDSKLANPLPTNTFVVNRKQMKGIIGLRSKDVAFRRGYYCIAGGYIRVEGQDNDLGKDGKPDPFKGALREAEFETGLSINKITCLGVGVDLIYGYPDILFLAETLDPVEKVFSSPKQDGYEMDACIVDLTNENDVRRYLDPKYIGTHDAACIILSIEKLLPDIYLGKRSQKRIAIKSNEDIGKQKSYAQMWTNGTAPKGELIDKEKFQDVVKNYTNYKIFIVDKGEYERKNTVGETYFNGKEVYMHKKGGHKKYRLAPLEYKLLVYILMKNNKENERFIYDLVENCWLAPSAANSLKELVKRGGLNFSGPLKKYSKAIGQLSSFLQNELGINCRSGGTGIYGLTTWVDFCVLKIVQKE